MRSPLNRHAWRLYALGALAVVLGARSYAARAAPRRPPGPSDAAFAANVATTDAYLARARRAYRRGDWPSTFQLALFLYRAREVRTLRLTVGERARALPETDRYADELRRHLDDAARLTRTPKERHLYPDPG